MIGLFTACLLAIAPLTAQQVSGKINGVVAEATGSVIAGATVKITSESTGQFRETKTSQEGVFEVTSLQPGMYFHCVRVVKKIIPIPTTAVITRNPRRVSIVVHGFHQALVK